ncbi:hypothetical protein ACFFK0_04370 [Paenibacillus chartarius]|uniref:Uncharacterized protein n=1 Tax=Paenibacillus chartarius TaxID=747481 RepID=A0ABV6DGC3_9BACL
MKFVDRYILLHQVKSESAAGLAKPLAFIPRWLEDHSPLPEAGAPLPRAWAAAAAAAGQVLALALRCLRTVLRAKRYQMEELADQRSFYVHPAAMAKNGLPAPRLSSSAPSKEYMTSRPV